MSPTLESQLDTLKSIFPDRDQKLLELTLSALNNNLDASIDIILAGREGEFLPSGSTVSAANNGNSGNLCIERKELAKLAEDESNDKLWTKSFSALDEFEEDSLIVEVPGSDYCTYGERKSAPEATAFCPTQALDSRHEGGGCDEPARRSMPRTHGWDGSVLTRLQKLHEIAMGKRPLFEGSEADEFHGRQQKIIRLTDVIGEGSTLPSTQTGKEGTEKDGDDWSVHEREKGLPLSVARGDVVCLDSDSEPEGASQPLEGTCRAEKNATPAARRPPLQHLLAADPSTVASTSPSPVVQLLEEVDDEALTGEFATAIENATRRGVSGALEGEGDNELPGKELEGPSSTHVPKVLLRTLGGQPGSAIGSAVPAACAVTRDMAVEAEPPEAADSVGVAWEACSLDQHISRRVSQRSDERTGSADAAYLSSSVSTDPSQSAAVGNVADDSFDGMKSDSDLDTWAYSLGSHSAFRKPRDDMKTGIEERATVEKKPPVGAEEERANGEGNAGPPSSGDGGGSLNTSVCRRGARKGLGNGLVGSRSSQTTRALQRERKAAEKAAQKAQKEAAKKLLSEQRQELREEKLAAKQAMKEKREQRAEGRAWMRKDCALKRMTTVIDTRLTGKLLPAITSKLAEKGYQYEVARQAVERSILWRMKQEREAGGPDSCGDLGSETQDAELHATSQGDVEDVLLRYVAVVMEPKTLCDLVAACQLDRHIRSVQAAHEGYAVCYLFNGLERYCQVRGNREYKSDQAALAGPRFDEAAVKQALVRMMTHHDHVHSLDLPQDEFVGDHVAGLHRALSEAPYRPNLSRFQISQNGGMANRRDEFWKEIQYNTWRKALVAIPGVAARDAIAISKAYPTMGSLLREYFSSRPEQDKELLLTGLAKEALTTAPEEQAVQYIGPTTSRKVFRVLTATDPNLNVQEAMQRPQLL